MDNMTVNLSKEIHEKLKAKAEKEGKKIYSVAEEMIKLGFRYEKILSQDLHTVKDND